MADYYTPTTTCYLLVVVYVIVHHVTRITIADSQLFWLKASGRGRDSHLFSVVRQDPNCYDIKIHVVYSHYISLFAKFHKFEHTLYIKLIVIVCR